MRYLFTISMLCCICFLYAQQSDNDDGAARLSLTVWIPDNIDGLTPAAEQNLHNKLSQIISNNGIYADPSNSRFVITANVIMLEKHFVSGPPARQLYKLDVTFYIGDGYEGKSFSNYNTSVTGVGENETKAFMNALRNIRTNSREYQSFIDKGKARIIDYYNRQCDFILKGAATSAAIHDYDAALSQLLSVPDVCAECWNKAMDAAVPIYQQKIDSECKALLLEATNVWNAGQSWRAAQSAGTILSMINPHASCFSEVLSLSDKIAKRILDVDKREWELKYDKEITLRQSMINARRDIGVAYGQNQRDNHVIYKSLW